MTSAIGGGVPSSEGIQALAPECPSAPEGVGYVLHYVATPGSDFSRFWMSFGFQPSGRQGHAGAPRLTADQLEAEFSAFAEEATDWAEHTWQAAAESWPDD